jgi:hypothetical protein
VVFHYLAQLWRRGSHVAMLPLPQSAAEVRKLAIIDFRSLKPLVNPLLNYLRPAFFP